jgi:2-keto-4-pentenoate hydratase/2-oxohepta-3-ene-1,7-dioic acid hydratase in catechol pathway
VREGKARETVQIVRYRAASEAGAEHVGVIEDGVVRQAQGDVFGKLQVGPIVGPLDEVTLLAPVQPSKLLAIGLNYKDHVTQDAPGFELPANPIVFLKPPTALVGSHQPIVYPTGVERLDAEAELAIVIGKQCRHVKAANAYDVILGFAASNDVSARDYQFKDGQWSRAKGFDSFAPVGPLVTGVRADDLDIICRVNGEVKQHSNTKHLLFGVPELIEFISRFTTLLPGDIIMTGTPAGPPQLHVGDVCEIEIAGLGLLRNTVVAEELPDA